MLMRLINGLVSRKIGENLMKKKGTRRSPIPLSVNLVSLVDLKKYASKEKE